MDTIFALATAAGKAGVAIIRVSGDQAWTAMQNLAGGTPAPRKTSLRVLRDSAGEFLDQAMVICFDRGESFTGERVAEFHIHGSVAVVRAILAELGRMPGLRSALPGEFTRRALDNGQLDLTQVEALADLIDAETDAQRKHAVTVLSGALSEKVTSWRAKLVRAAALLEATIDFVDEEVPVDVSGEVFDLVSLVASDIHREVAGIGAAERVKTGFEVAIVGPPNAGKSTLLNFLAGREAAITSDIAGTTRDVIEVRMDVGGLAVTFLDTAGLRDTIDPVEAIGVSKARARAEAADLRIHLASQNAELLVAVKDGDIVLVPKCDDEAVSNGISGLTGQGVPRLMEHISTVLSDRVGNAGLASNERHRENLSGSLRVLHGVLADLEDDGHAADLVSEDIRVASRYLEAMIGKIDVETVLDEIFSSFCIGK